MRIRDPKTTALIFKSGKMVRGASPTQPRHSPLLRCGVALRAAARGRAALAA
jgi:TATA-box binding protein (TBP) (component of TFIID and TFIIIB)